MIFIKPTNLIEVLKIPVVSLKVTIQICSSSTTDSLSSIFGNKFLHSARYKFITSTSVVDRVKKFDLWKPKKNFYQYFSKYPSILKSNNVIF